MLVAYFTVAVAAQSRLHAPDYARQLARSGGGSLHFHMAHGAYVGLAGAVLALVGAILALREGKVDLRLSARSALTQALALGLLIALLLPAERVGVPTTLSQIGVVSPPGTLAAALAICLVALVLRGERPLLLERLAVVGGIAVFVAAAADVGFAAVRNYGTWVAVGFTVLLVLASLNDVASLRSPRLAARDIAVGVAGAAFVATLFLPWQDACYGQNSDLRALGLSGRCVSTNGFGIVGSTSALVAMVLLSVVLLRVARFLARPELAVTFAILVCTLGFQLSSDSQSGVQLSFGYGSILGFVSAAALVAAAIVPSSRMAIVLRPNAPFALIAAVVAAAYVAAIVVPWWGILPDTIWATFVPRLAAVSWLTVASALVGVRLAYLWLRRARAATRDHLPELVAASLALIALTLLETLPLPTVRLTWNMAVLLGLAGSLGLLTLIEARGGIRGIQIPEILRIDRIQPPSAD